MAQGQRFISLYAVNINTLQIYACLHGFVIVQSLFKKKKKTNTVSKNQREKKIAIPKLLVFCSVNIIAAFYLIVVYQN